MLPYYLVLFHTSSLLLLSLNIHRYQQRWVAYYCVAIITAFAAVRGYVGTDTYSYHMMFYEYGSADWTESFKAIEPLFVLLIKLSSLASDNPFFFTAFVSVVQGAILVKLINTSKRPAIFLLVFIAAFYCDFEFNILRAGTATMLLILASRYIDRMKTGSFYSYVVSAVLMHYTALIGLLFLVYTKERRWLVRMFVTAFVLIALWLISYFLIIDSARLGKLIYYVSNIERDEELKYGLGFYAIQVIYFLLYISVVNKENFTSRTFLFLSWIVLVWATLSFGYVDRLKVVISALFLFLSIECDVVGWRKMVRTYAIISIAMLSLIGSLKSIEKSSVSNDFDFTHSMSPFIPYSFFWNEPSR